MNLASNLIKATLAVVIGLAITHKSYAQDCGLITIEEIEGTETALRLVEVDDLFFFPNYKQLKRKKEMKIGSGERVLHFIEEPKTIPRTTSRELSKLLKSEAYRAILDKKHDRLISKLKHHYMAISIETNKRYKVSLSKDDQRMVVQSVSDHQCKKLKENYEQVKTTKFHFADLPFSLQQQFNEVFAQPLFQNLRYQQGFIPYKNYRYFGVTANTMYSKAGGINVISVAPNSSAFYIGLLANDEIVEVSGNKVTHKEQAPAQQFEQQITTIPFYAPVTMKVIRDGKEVILEGINRPVAVPSSWYSIEADSSTVNYSGSFSSNEQSSIQPAYDSLMLQLASIFQIENGERAELVIPKRKKTALGLKGDVVNGKGLKITSIKADSLLANLNLVQGDIITGVGNELMMPNSGEDLVGYISDLKAGEYYQLEIERHGVKKVVHNTYESRFYQSSTLHIDFSNMDPTGVQQAQQAHNLKGLYLSLLLRQITPYKSSSLVERVRNNLRRESKPVKSTR